MLNSPHINSPIANNAKHKQPLNPRIATHDEEPVAKKSKEQQAQHSDPNLRCEECNMVFDSLIQSVDHFKYTRHGFRDAREHPDENNSLRQNNAVDLTHVDAGESNDPQPVGKSSEEDPAKSAEPVFDIITCEDCNVRITNPNSAYEHFQGKRHHKVLAEKEAAVQRSVMDMWQKSGTGSGPDVGARGGGRASRFGPMKKVRPGPKLPSVGLGGTQGIGRGSHMYRDYGANIGHVMNASMQRNANNGFSDFSQYGDAQHQSSNYGTPHQTDNYGTPRQTDDYATPRQTDNYATARQTDNYATAQYQDSRYETPQYQSHSAQGMNKNSSQVNPNDSYSRASQQEQYYSGNQN